MALESAPIKPTPAFLAIDALRRFIDQAETEPTWAEISAAVKEAREVAERPTLDGQWITATRVTEAMTTTHYSDDRIKSINGVSTLAALLVETLRVAPDSRYATVTFSGADAPPEPLAAGHFRAVLDDPETENRVTDLILTQYSGQDGQWKLNPGRATTAVLDYLKATLL